MPHRVTNFLRSSSGNVPHVKKAIASSRSTSRSGTPDTSDSEEYYSNNNVHIAGRKMSDVSAEAKKHHRLSLPFGKSSKDGSGHGGAPAVIEWSMESPPIVFHGTTEDSTGALVSGLMYLDVKADLVDVEFFNATLNLHVNHRQAFYGNCQDCRHQYTELAHWNLLGHPTQLSKGRHQYPFSVLLPGHLPASMSTPLITIAYDFTAEAIVTPSPVTGPATAVKFEKTIPVKRSIPEPDLPHHSVRVFPPTNIKASAHYAGVIHPTGVNKLNLRLDGLTSLNEGAQTLEMWKLKKLTWKLEETIKTIAPACEKHIPAVAPGEDEAKKGATRSDTRTIGEKHLHDGWKSSYTSTDGNVEMELDYNITQFRAYSRDPKHACDVKTSDGTEVTHSLLVELVVSKEFAPEGKPHMATQTGTGRILRMHFAVVMTDYPGLGVSWDNEAPPVYQDVPPSPPAYPCDECPVEYDNLEPLDARRSSVEPLGSPDYERAPSM
jgi:hypothetical protein